VLDLAERELGGKIAGRTIAVLGAAFKPNSDDVRDSPALDVAGRLHLMGASVRVYDPQAMNNAKAVWPTLTFAQSMMDAVRDADLVVVSTEWQEFRDADPAVLRSHANGDLVIDARNCLDVDGWKAAGWRYRGMGRHAT
jgi:UDPglucose 6-dehydrogenase